MRRFRLVLAVAALTVLGAGCIKGSVDVTVERDGSATMTMEIALDPDSPLAEMASEFGGEELSPEQMRDQMRDDMEADLDDLPEGATVEIEEIELDDWPGLRVEIGGLDVDDLPELMGDDPAPDDFIGRDGEGWRFSMETSAVVTGTAGSPLTGEEAGAVEGDEGMEAFAKMLYGDASLTWRITMPGRVTDHEGGEVSGSTVEWEIPLADPPDHISASWDGKASPGGGGSGVLPIVLGGVAVAAAAAGFVVWKRRGTPPPASEAPASPVGAAAPGGSTPGWPAPDAPVVEG